MPIQMIMPQVSSVWTRLSCSILKLSSRRSTEMISTDETPSAAASVIEATPA